MGRIDRATVAVAEHHDQRNTEEPDTVFETGKAVIVDEVAREPHDKHLTRPLVECKLGRHTRVGTAEHRGERILRRGTGGAARGEILYDGVVRGVALVSLHQPPECLVGADGVRRRGPGLRERPLSERTYA